MEIKKDEYLLKFAPEMMETTYAWCKGAKFTEICEISETPIFFEFSCMFLSHF